jgi:anti-sigma28 factor (negative regulator of flagellin synthesis)
MSGIQETVDQSSAHMIAMSEALTFVKALEAQMTADDSSVSRDQVAALKGSIEKNLTHLNDTNEESSSEKSRTGPNSRRGSTASTRSNRASARSERQSESGSEPGSIELEDKFKNLELASPNNHPIIVITSK